MIIDKRKSELIDLVESFGSEHENLALQVLKAISKAELAQQETQRIFNASLDILGTLDFNGYILNINPVFSEILGYAVAETIGRCLFDLIHPNDVEMVKASLENAIAQHKAAFEVRILSNSGALRWLSWVVTADADNERLHFVSRDVSNRKEQDKQFEDLRSALDEAAIVAITDVGGKIIYVNEKFCAISQYSEVELIGQDHRIINSGHHPKDFIRDIWQTIANGNVWRGEIKNKAKDGSFYWVDTTIVPFLNEQGKPYQYVAIRYEITERKTVQAELENLVVERRRQDKLVTDLRSALDEAAIVAITDVSGKITYINERFCAISKYSENELIGQDHRIINSGHHSKEFIRDLWVTIANGNVWRGEIQNKAKDGSFYWVDTTIVPFLNEQGKPYQYVAIRYEVTERKAAQAQLEKLVLELKVAYRLANDNARLKSEFLATMSHELRTPMNAIEGFTSVMLKNMGGAEYNDKTKRYLEKVHNNSKRLLNLINDFLDLSRIEAGRLELSNLAISPLEMALKWQDAMSSLAETKHLHFETQIDPSLPELIYGDEEALSKIAINLLGNAFKFTAQGTISLSLKREGDYMAIAVADTGIGIPPHAREFIFDEFRQVDQSSKRLYGGTGLGLSIVQKLARLMGGTVTVQSEVGKGSIFTVQIPIHTQPEYN